MEIVLSPRLRAVAGLVRPGSVVADIGTDHAYLVCWLVASARCPGGFACDINPLPLERARKTIAQYGLTGQVQAVLSDGLAGLKQAQFDDVVIAGMGGELIAQIIQSAPWARQHTRFLLQPMTKPERLREWLAGNGFAVLKEVAVQESRFVYPILEVAHTGQTARATVFDAWVGKMWENTDEAASRYLQKVHRQMKQAQRGVLRKSNAAYALEFDQTICRIQQRLEGQLP